MTSFTFKAQAKSNAKRFLVATCKLDNFEDYLTQHEGSWGCWLGADGKPVAAHLLPSTTETPTLPEAPAPVVEAPAPATLEEEVALIAGSDTAAAAFGALAFGQLTAPTNTVPAAPTNGTTRNEARQGATPTSGLKIQRDRPEQNGIRRQSAGSVGDKLWSLYDAIGPTCTLEQAKQAATDAGLSTTSAAIALYNWRKFHGIPSGRTATTPPAAQ